MKRLYEFTVFKKESKEVPIESINDQGNKTITLVKEEVEVPYKFFVARPTRKMREQAELFHGQQYGIAIKNNLIPAALLQKRFENDDGILSEKSKEKYKTVFSDYISARGDLEKFLLTEKDYKNDPDKKKEYENLVFNVKTLRDRIVEYQVAHDSLYANTPESFAKNKLISWLLLHLSYEVRPDGTEAPFFGDGSYEERMAQYEDGEDRDDPFYKEVYLRFVEIVGLYHYTGADNQEELDKKLASDY